MPRPFALLLVCGLVAMTATAGFGPVYAQRAGTAIGALRIAVQTAPAAVPRFGRFEVDFAVDNSSATQLHWPFDAAAPNGIVKGEGISVDGVFVDPQGREYRQPAFYFQQFEEAVRDNRDWQYPTSRFVWKVRFSPNQAGTWRYKLTAQDRGGRGETEWRSFTVASSTSRGFVRVSRADRRYFEFEDGTFFTGLGFQFPEFLEDPITRGGPAYAQLSAAGVNFARIWISSLYGSAWTPYVGGRNRYAGYLPVAGLTPFVDAAAGRTTLAMQLDYSPRGDDGWFDACRLQFANDPEAVKPNTRYRVRATYQGRRIAGPRTPRSAQFGLVVKLGGMFPNCYEPGTGRVITDYGRNTAQWGQLEGIWNSGNQQFLPKLHVALENVTDGVAFVRSLSVREILADGSEGAEILTRPSMEHELYIPQARARAFDHIVELAERHGVYLKVVVMEKGDEMYLKMEDNGEFVTARDNAAGFYGTGRNVNKTRWLQQAWWRYLQARWGYSPNIHSWELVNEGDPASVRHYELADEFGKYMHYGVFGAAPGAAFDHPNDHLVTTSFWHSFPAAAFWRNAAYPHIDYADLHAYVSTSTAPAVEKQKMQNDAAFYHTWHSQSVAAAAVGKPVVRGEAGLDLPARQDEFALGLQRDRTGTWLHNFLWSGLDSGGLYELYWWRTHIWNNQVDHRTTYRLVNEFLSGLELNKGGYVDWSGRASDAALRVVGQKNVAAGAMHLWIQNARHTWRNVMDGQVIEPASGSVQVPGFRPRAVFDVEWWDTYARDKAVSTAEVTADAMGTITLAVTSLQRDVAVKLRPKTPAAF